MVGIGGNKVFRFKFRYSINLILMLVTLTSFLSVFRDVYEFILKIYEKGFINIISFNMFLSIINSILFLSTLIIFILIYNNKKSIKYIKLISYIYFIMFIVNTLGFSLNKPSEYIGVFMGIYISKISIVYLVNSILLNILFSETIESLIYEKK